MTDADTTAPTLADAKAEGKRLAKLKAARESVGPAALLTRDEAAVLLAVTVRTLSKLAASPGFPARVAVWGDLVRYRRADLERWAAQLKANRSPKSVKEPK